MINMTTDKSEIKVRNKKATIHTLDLVDRGKWLKLDYLPPFMTFNTTDPNPEFTSFGWVGLASVTIDLAWLEREGVEISDLDKLNRGLKDLYLKYAVKNEHSQEINNNSDKEEAIKFFSDNEPEKSKKVSSVPEEAINLCDRKSRKYAIVFSRVVRFRSFTNKETGEKFFVEDFYCLASDAPNAVKRILKY